MFSTQLLCIPLALLEMPQVGMLMLVSRNGTRQGLNAIPKSAFVLNSVHQLHLLSSFSFMP